MIGKLLKNWKTLDKEYLELKEHGHPPSYSCSFPFRINWLIKRRWYFNFRKIFCTRSPSLNLRSSQLTIDKNICGKGWTIGETLDEVFIAQMYNETFFVETALFNSKVTFLLTHPCIRVLKILLFQTRLLINSWGHLVLRSTNKIKTKLGLLNVFFELNFFH